MGAIFGTASFSCAGRLGTPVKEPAAPERMEASMSTLGGSDRLVVFSVHRRKVRTEPRKESNLPQMVPLLIPRSYVL